MDDVFPVKILEIHVDVWHLVAGDVQESLKEEAVFDGIGDADAKGIGNKGTGTRSAARADEDAVSFRIGDVIRDDEEIIRVAHREDDGELLLETFKVLAARVRFPFQKAFKSLLSKIGFRALALWDGEMGKAAAFLNELESFGLVRNILSGVYFFFGELLRGFFLV